MMSIIHLWKKENPLGEKCFLSVFVTCFSSLSIGGAGTLNAAFIKKTVALYFTVTWIMK